MTWSEANASCAALGDAWSLSSVLDLVTGASVVDSARCGGAAAAAAAPYWTGLVDSAPGSRAFNRDNRSYAGWAWSSGASAAYFLGTQADAAATYWHAGEPNDDTKTSAGGENCVEVLALGRLNDLACGGALPACCMWLPPGGVLNSNSPTGSATATGSSSPSASAIHARLLSSLLSLCDRNCLRPQRRPHPLCWTDDGSR